MTIMQNATTDQTYGQGAVVARDDAARALPRRNRRARRAKAHVDQWISAANDRLHIAVARYLAADTLVVPA
jgi:hypothetical protein